MEKVEIFEITLQCHICSGRAVFVANQVFLNKYDASYYQCSNCQYLFVYKVDWMKEAYKEVITSLDTGLVQRNIWFANRLSRLIKILKRRNGIFLDWSGGVGLLSRLMRDKGFDYFWIDKHASNTLATGFEFDNNAIKSVDLVSLIEVLEHLENPLLNLKEIIQDTKCEYIVFSQELYSGIFDQKWWYLMPQTGQHVSFYSRRTLIELSKQIGMNFYQFGDLFIFSRNKEISTFRCMWERFLIIIKLNVFKLINQKSLTWSDHINMRQKLEMNINR